jgi:Histidine phosphatase superfamily (branch 1)
LTVRARIFVFIVAVLALSVGVGERPASAQPGVAVSTAHAPLTGRALADALRRGGYVLYFRHTSTDFGQNDEGMTSYEDCTKQRNLTEQGRAEARAIGAAIGRLKIPIGDVLASPFCRTVETGRLVFGRATSTQAVRGGPAVSEDSDRYSALKKLFSTPVPGGVNTAISSHGNPFRAVTGAPYLAEGEAAVIEPLGTNGFRIVARIPKDGWDKME